MKKLIAAALALTMILSMAACSEKTDSSSDASSVTESSSAPDSSSTTETTTTTTSATTTTTQASSESPEKTEKETTTTPNTEPPQPSVGIDLKTVAVKNFAAQEITYSGDPQKAFAQTAAEPAGTFSIFADVKTNQLFDPFDDLIEDERHIATVKADSQVFIEFQSFEYEDEGHRDTTIDGYVEAVCFNCKDEEEAKKLFSLVFSDSMKNEMTMDKDVKKYDIGTDHAISCMGDDEAEMHIAYYRVGNNVIAAAQCTFDLAAARVTPLNYTKKYDYKQDLDKLCKAFGAAKLPSSVK